MNSRDLVHELCSPACAGRAPGTPGGIRARGFVRDALRDVGLDPAEQLIRRGAGSGGSSGASGANLVATVPGDVDRWVLVAAHYDHLGGRFSSDGRTLSQFYPGADDNAAAVAILVEVARRLKAAPPSGRGVIIAAFDAEEPPYFLTGEMGSAYYAKHATEVGPAIDRIDFMVCMDLVGHAFGPEGLPDSVRSSLFALGAERSTGTTALVQEIAHAEEGVIIRQADAEIIPPLSDYDPFWKRNIPFLFLTGGRTARYHTPQDTPEHLDWPKIESTTAWLERFVRRTCARSDETHGGNIDFIQNARDDGTTLQSFIDLVTPLIALSPLAANARERAESLLTQCTVVNGVARLPQALANAPSELVLGLEGALS